jgi:ssDNA-binding Zn-finger/Zn-ribbon topoisomerase 1
MIARSPVKTKPTVAERCPRCDDALELYHTASGRPRHFLGCRSYPRCSYTADYDAVLAGVLEAIDMRLVSLEAQHRWMRAMLEELFERLEERRQP